MDTPTGENTGRAQKPFWRIPLAVVLIAVIILILLQSVTGGGIPGVSRNQWQAVFLNNNQVYFGHLRDGGRDFVALKDVFYLQIIQPLQQGAEVPPPPTFNLVKLGNELHGPQDVMYIPKNNILFWENMRNDSPVVQQINNFLQQQKK